ncbi:MAG: hypothetical protein NT157_05265 [Candidatus Micrarchaeota archaeon]|nr:hypothetical protein [Candidatus Micrarchaeota archaeon]
MDKLDADAVYVPWLHMHQPLIWFSTPQDMHEGGKPKLIGNLEKMLYEGNYDAQKMARAYMNPAIFVKKLREAGKEPKIMLDFSGTLLESLQRLSESGKLDEMEVHVDMAGTDETVGNFVKIYREVLSKYPDNIEMTGTGYYHPYFPAIPTADWEAHITKWRAKYAEMFGEEALANVKGFWLPEMGIPGEEEKLFEMISLLKKHGYKWLILPAVENLDFCAVEGKGKPMNRFELFNEPHILKARKGKKEEGIVAVVREPGIDQQSGFGAGGIPDKAKWIVKERGKKALKPALLVPTSDGENGNVMMNQFFYVSYEPFYMGIVGAKIGGGTLESMCVSEYLEGILKRELGGVEWERAAETSCYVYWGSDFWFDQGEATIALANRRIDEMEKGGKK